MGLRSGLYGGVKICLMFPEPLTTTSNEIQLTEERNPLVEKPVHLAYAGIQLTSILGTSYYERKRD